MPRFRDARQALAIAGTGPSTPVRGFAQMSQNNDEKHPPADDPAEGWKPLSEPSSLLWRCSQCSANVVLHYRRRDPGHCPRCGARSMKPWPETAPRG
jgi:rubrerythrin